MPSNIADPAPQVLRGSAFVALLAQPVPCDACPPRTAPHECRRELRYWKGRLRIAIPVCDANALLMLDEVCGDASNVADGYERVQRLLARITDLEVKNAELDACLTQQSRAVSELEAVAARVGA